MYNMDKTGLSAVQKPPKVIAEKGKRTVGIITSAERGTNATVVCAMSATGHFVALYFLFPRKNSIPF